jgi:hypothetical protein
LKRVCFKAADNLSFSSSSSLSSYEGIEFVHRRIKTVFAAAAANEIIIAGLCQPFINVGCLPC